MLPAGTRVDRYVVESLLGQGAMAQVYRVRHAELPKAYALKVLTSVDTELVERFRREQEILARLRHPNLVAIHNAFLVGGRPAFVLDLVEGGTLASHLAQGPLPTAEALRLFVGIVSGVQAAHEQGVVHRDLKPENVLLEAGPEGPVPRVADFGIAALRTPGSAAAPSTCRFGTPGYAAPEVVDGRPMDARADVFALGAILFELLTGAPAFPGDTWTERISAAVGGRLPPLDVPAIPPFLRATLASCLAVDPARRPEDCRALLAALRVPEGTPQGTPPKAHGTPPKAQGSGATWRVEEPPPRPPAEHAAPVSTAPVTTEPTPPQPRGAGSGRAAALAAAAAVLALLVGIAAWGLRQPGPPDRTEAAASPPPTAAALAPTDRAAVEVAAPTAAEPGPLGPTPEDPSPSTEGGPGTGSTATSQAPSPAPSAMAATSAATPATTSTATSAATSAGTAPPSAAASRPTVTPPPAVVTFTGPSEVWLVRGDENVRLGTATSVGAGTWEVHAAWGDGPRRLVRGFRFEVPATGAVRLDCPSAEEGCR